MLVLDVQSTGTGTYELRPTTVSADCKVMRMAGVLYKSGTPPCTVGGCAPFIETLRCDVSSTYA